jgi:hypothetical protein
MSSKVLSVKRILPIALAICVVLVAVALFVPQTASAGATHDKIVNGYVEDNAGNPYPGVTVAVTIDGNTKSELTNSLGYYDLLFLSAEWTVTSTISVVAQYQSGSPQSTSVAADDSVAQTMTTLIFPYEIPEMGSSLGLIAAGILVGAVAIVVVTFVRRK